MRDCVVRILPVLQAMEEACEQCLQNKSDPRIPMRVLPNQSGKARFSANWSRTKPMVIDNPAVVEAAIELVMCSLKGFLSSHKLPDVKFNLKESATRIPCFQPRNKKPTWVKKLVSDLKLSAPLSSSLSTSSVTSSATSATSASATSATCAAAATSVDEDDMEEFAPSFERLANSPTSNLISKLLEMSGRYYKLAKGEGIKEASSDEVIHASIIMAKFGVVIMLVFFRLCFPVFRAVCM